MDEELKAHHYWREDRITGRLVVITPDEYEQWGKDNQPSEAYRPAFTRAQLPNQGGEAVEVVAWQDAENPLYTTAERRVMHDWAGNGYPIVELMTVAQHQRILAAATHPADKVAERNAELVELLRGARAGLDNVGLQDSYIDYDAVSAISTRIDAKLASLKGVEE